MVKGRCRGFIPAKKSYSQGRQEPSNMNLGTIKQFKCRTQNQKYAEGRWGPGGNARCQARNSLKEIMDLVAGISGKQGSSRSGRAAQCGLCVWPAPGSPKPHSLSLFWELTLTYSTRGFHHSFREDSSCNMNRFQQWKPPLTDWAIFNSCETLTSPHLPRAHHRDGRTRFFVNDKYLKW